jgi:hypothetical protein
MTLPPDQPMPEREQPFNEGSRHGIGRGAAHHASHVPTARDTRIGARIGAGLVRTFSGYFWWWSGRVQVDEVRGDRVGLKPVAAPRAPKAPSTRDKWIGAGIAAALILGCVVGLRLWVG